MRLPVAFLMFLSLSPSPAPSEQAGLADAYPGRARYAPSEPVSLMIELQGRPADGDTVAATIRHLDRTTGGCRTLVLRADSPLKETLFCALPATDYRGYLVTVDLRDISGHLLAERHTAIDVSSSWSRFPRYGYLAHYNREEGADPEQWIDQLNRFHINGLQFYDFQSRHDRSLAGTVSHPEPRWKDIAGRTIDGGVLRAFLDEAHRHNMMAMAYNAGYSAYDDVFTRQQDPLPLEWATWKTPDGERSALTAKSLPIHGGGWSTSCLFYMNQNDPAWQRYIFAQMKNLLAVYPFDGWHVDTFGERGGYTYRGAWTDFIDGARDFISRASSDLRRPIVMNAVNAMGQELIANSAAAFVYSELWEDHETFAGILEAAEQVHVANPLMGLVFAAYVHRVEDRETAVPASREFNPPAVLLADASIFASGAGHIELGDGLRMLSSEYFPADTRLSISPALRESLRHYYDYLTAYENYLRDDMRPAPGLEVSIDSQPSDSLAVPDTIWVIARRNSLGSAIHLINLRGTGDPHWRDISMSRPEPPILHALHVRIVSLEPVRVAGWASPDRDGGAYHPVRLERAPAGRSRGIEVTLPSLQYWDTIFLER